MVVWKSVILTTKDGVSNKYELISYHVSFQINVNLTNITNLLNVYNIGKYSQ